MNHGSIFEEFFGVPNQAQAESRLRCDVFDSKDAYYFEFDVPGVPRENMEITVKDYELVVSATRPLAKIDESVTLRSEKVCGKLKRTFALPHGHVQVDAIEASHREGVLRVKVPKSTAARPQQIKIGDEDVWVPPKKLAVANS